MDKGKEALQRDFNYEEDIMEELSEYFLGSLEDIEGLTEEEVKKLRGDLNLLLNETKGHKKIFTELIKYIKEHGNNYE